MASIRKEIEVNRGASAVWEAICDFGAAHVRLFPGVLTDVKLEGGARIVTFANGLVVREDIVDVSDATMRFVYTASGGRATHHNASLEVFSGENGGSRIVWTTDFLPNDIAGTIDGLMNAGSAAMRAALGR
jgi:carbon monoxide dehydrogenase subunit G